SIPNYIRDQPPNLFQQDEVVFLDQSKEYPVFAKRLRACRSQFNTVTVKENAQLTKCIVKKLIVGGSLRAHLCNLTMVKVRGKVNLLNCYQIDSITANDDIKLVSEKIGKLFVNLVETQKSAHIKNMDIGELIFRSGHTIIDNCNIACIRIKRPERSEKECILELVGDYQVGTIISEGVDVEIRGRKLEP
ncbi:MAG: hypothetical protein AABZ92_05330, partial [Verrucomicrobiota bacterium]